MVPGCAFPANRGRAAQVEFLNDCRSTCLVLLLSLRRPLRLRLLPASSVAGCLFVAISFLSLVVSRTYTLREMVSALYKACAVGDAPQVTELLKDASSVDIEVKGEFRQLSVAFQNAC